ncbi:MAG: glutamate racemase [Bacteroidales bacterium]|jgi:glutamate racemase|nr:glutamate racemase [Bacteroidales bacterium]
MDSSPIGVFDSGYGGLTVLKELIKSLPEYDFLYLGDNARTPYGTRSFKVVYSYTLQAVKYLFSRNCHLIIIACNTASSKVLRSIQQIDLPEIAPGRRVLGVIRPTAEEVAGITQTGHVGVLGTTGTILSGSYPVELKKCIGEKFKSAIQEACPLWVPLVENSEIDSDGADFFVKKNIQNILKKDKKLDTLILGCTHYPLLINLIKKYVPGNINIIEQGAIVAKKLTDYLNRHPEINKKISKNRQVRFQTTESAENFNEKAAFFIGKKINAESVHLD